MHRSTRNHHLAPSSAEREKQAVAFGNNHNPHSIMIRYKAGQINAERARALLETSNSRGVLWAGELAVEAAYQAKTTDQKSALLSYAGEMFRKAYHAQSIATGGRVDDVSAGARLGLAELPIHSGLVLNGALPSFDVAKKAYTEMVKTGADLSAAYWPQRHSGDPEDLNNISRLVGKVVGSGLLGRFALYQIGPESWYPVSALMTEQHSNRHGSSVYHGWDLSVFADRGEAAISRDYRLKMRTTRPLDTTQDRPVESGIAVVNINPDLRLLDGETYLSFRIVDDLHSELVYPRPGSTTSRMLDERQDLLLATLDPSLAA